MADIQVLNSNEHRDIRVVVERGAEYGDNSHIVPVVADELRNLALEYPVVLVKDPDSGRYGLCALLGFDQGENLYLDGNDWDAAYIPVHVRRQPFALTYTAEKDGKPDPSSLAISVDMDSQRISQDQGERLFEEDGSQSEFLNSMQELLAGLGPAMAGTNVFIDTLDQHSLIEPAQLDVQFAGGEKRRFDGLYTVHDGRLSELEGDALADLYKRGFLQAAWLMLASVGNMRKLLLRRAKKQEH